MASSILQALGRLSAGILYLAAFGLAFGEAAFLLDLLIPGEVGLVVVGAAGRHHGASLPLLIALGVSGAFAGDSMSWFVGSRWGTSVVNRWAWTRRFVAPHLDRSKGVLERRGGPAIFAARWVGALRALVPLVSGAADVPYRTMVLWDLPSAIAWSATAVSLGWFLGEPVADVVDRYGLYLSVAVAAGMLMWWLVHRRQGRDHLSPAGGRGRPISPGPWHRGGDVTGDAAVPATPGQGVPDAATRRRAARPTDSSITAGPP